MKVHCQTCGTDFNLDESLIPPEGAWVRCSLCGEVFQVAPPAQEAPAPAEPEPQLEDLAPPATEEPQPAPEPSPQGFELSPAEATAASPDSFWAEEAAPSSLDLSQMGPSGRELARQRADFGLEQQPETAVRPPRGPLFKALFWLIGIMLLAIITALGAVVVMSRLGVGPELVDQAARVPGMAPLLGRSTEGGSRGVETATPQMSLVEVKSFNRVNETSGRIFVIQGKVVNHHRRPRSSILVQGSLRDAAGKVVRQASSYAGSVFTPEELRFLSLGAIERRLSSPLALDGRPYVVAPGEPLPFMIVLTNVPDQPQEYTAAVIGSEPAEEKPVLR